MYKNVLRAIDNVGINAAYVIKYNLKGINLEEKEMQEYLRSQVQSKEYLQQASNFAIEINKTLDVLWASHNNKKLQKM